MTEHLLDQRIRNRIIEYLALAASFGEQSAYQAVAPRVHIPNEVINQWEDWVRPDWRDELIAPTFSSAEIEAIGRFYVVWEAVAAATPDPLPALPALLETPQWQRLASAAAEALVVFNHRGRLPEDEGGPADGAVSSS
ncbi:MULTISPECIES: hypothetical protein [Lysobacter]|uniref:hypothetical protein n=1 Tax=Lysobacter TaxID=68 RepID=UPI001F41F0CA|nr:MULTISPECIES: hypothetical protein [Lysobacter]UJB17328.1 hypothetical protein L1A79_13105 [Lysobacter capsici]UJQ28949.1 hypothetical protein L2D09_01760 [Lysobacter gummosus]